MSRVGKVPIKIPEKVTIDVKDCVIEVKGPRGSMHLDLPGLVNVSVSDGEVIVSRDSDNKDARAHHGLIRNLISNMVRGVSEGFSKTLDINGVGYRAEVKGEELVLSLGYSHPINFAIPEGISITVNKQTQMVLEGIDKQLVGETAARIRLLRPPEPYKSKGIKYSDEIIKRKAGKTAV
jgi:large subunit ribosomal protein L6